MATHPNNPNPEISVTVPEISVTVPLISITIPEIPAIHEWVLGNNGEAGCSSTSEEMVGEKNKKKYKKIKAATLMDTLRNQVVPDLSELSIPQDSSNPKHLLQAARGNYKQSYMGYIPPRDNPITPFDEGINQNDADNVSNEADQNEESTDDVSSWQTDPDNEDDDDPNDGWGIEPGMFVLRYVNQHMQIGFVDVLNSLNIFPEDFADWNALARVTLQFWQMVNPDSSNIPELDNATAANCWPGSVTIFGKVTVEGQQASFQRLNWSEHDFEDVKANINCLIAIEI